MIRFGTVLAALALSALGQATAAAATPFPPEAGAMAKAERVAFAYWHGNPPCGKPNIVFRPQENGGEADPATCTLYLDSQQDWSEFFRFCVTVTHEWGHLVLGPMYFYSVNPTDPWHSPKPESIMYWQGPVFFRPCEPPPYRPARRTQSDRSRRASRPSRTKQ